MNDILVTTENWTPERLKIRKLIYCEYGSEKKNTNVPFDIFEIDVTTCTRIELCQFFKKVSKFCGHNNIEHSQFHAILDDGQRMPMKWFWIDVNGITISHDCAFDTILVKKGRIPICIGMFRRERIWKSKHAYSKNKRDAYKVIANMIFRKKG